MTTYVLDYAKWRAGPDSGPFMIGLGETRMRNTEGYMCCLGQFASQKGIDGKEMTGAADPAELSNERLSGTIYDSNFVELLTDEEWCDSPARITPLAERLIEINDEGDDLPPMVRIKKLKREMEDAGLELKVINLPNYVKVPITNTPTYEHGTLMFDHPHIGDTVVWSNGKAPKEYQVIDWTESRIKIQPNDATDEGSFHWVTPNLLYSVCREEDV